MFQKESAIIRQKLSYMKLQQYNLKYLYLKLNSYRGNGKRIFLRIRTVIHFVKYVLKPE